MKFADVGVGGAAKGHGHGAASSGGQRGAAQVGHPWPGRSSTGSVLA